MRSLLHNSTQLHGSCGSRSGPSRGGTYGYKTCRLMASSAVQCKRHCRAVVDLAASGEHSDNKQQPKCRGPERIARAQQARPSHFNLSGLQLETASTGSIRNTAEALVVALKSLEDIRDLQSFVVEHCSESEAVQRHLQAAIEAQQHSVACLQQLQQQETEAASPAKTKLYPTERTAQGADGNDLPFSIFNSIGNTAISASANLKSHPIVIESMADVYESKLGLRPQPLVVDSPTSSDDEPEAQQLTGIWAGVAAGRGTKSYMEDVNAIIWLHPDEGVLPYSKHKIDSTLVAGVYDGHGGRSTAAYVAAQLPHLLQKELLTNDGHSRIVPAAVTKQQLLSNVYHELDNEWAQQGHFEQSGSTAVTAMINKKNLVIANAGDSVAVLARGASSRRLSKSHNLCCPDELARVTAAGGQVVTDRMGKPRLVQSLDRCQRYVAPKTLALSRGFGDFGFKGVGGDLVIPTPYVAELDLTPDDGLLLLTSDGITDVLRDDDIMEVAMNAISKERNNTSSGSELAAAAAAAVKATAATAGAWDNFTVLAILLDWSSS